jgi:hypothetical protein
LYFISYSFVLKIIWNKQALEYRNSPCHILLE